MNTLLRFIPLVIGLGAGFFLVRLAYHLEKPIAYPTLFLGLLALTYFFTVFDIWMKKRTVEIITYKDIEPNYLAHILNVLVSAVATYGILEHVTLVMVLAMIAMFYADDLLKHRKKEIQVSNTLSGSRLVEEIDNRSFIDAVQTSRKVITQIAEYAKENNFKEIKLYNTEKITKSLTYNDKGKEDKGKEDKEKEHFLVLGALEGDSKIGYMAHEKLFFLVNDINALKMFSNINDVDESLIEEYQYRILDNALYLEHYFYVLEENTQKKTMSNIEKNEKTIRNIHDTASLYYGIMLTNLKRTNQLYSNKYVNIESKIAEIPHLPVGLGTILDEDAQLLNIYMPNEMAQVLKEWMASMQAKAMVEQSHHTE